MALPDFTEGGLLPPGIHACSLATALARFATLGAARARQGELLRLVVEAAKNYPSIKRVLVWGSFVTAKPAPNDLDYSVVVDKAFTETGLKPEHRRFFALHDARMFYGADRGYLRIAGYPVALYAERLGFLLTPRFRGECGILEINLRGEELNDGTD